MKNVVTQEKIEEKKRIKSVKYKNLNYYENTNCPMEKVNEQMSSNIEQCPETKPNVLGVRKS